MIARLGRAPDEQGINYWLFGRVGGRFLGRLGDTVVTPAARNGRASMRGVAFARIS